MSSMLNYDKPKQRSCNCIELFVWLRLLMSPGRASVLVLLRIRRFMLIYCLSATHLTHSHVHNIVLPYHFWANGCVCVRVQSMADDLFWWRSLCTPCSYAKLKVFPSIFLAFHLDFSNESPSWRTFRFDVNGWIVRCWCCRDSMVRLMNLKETSIRFSQWIAKHCVFIHCRCLPCRSTAKRRHTHTQRHSQISIPTEQHTPHIAHSAIVSVRAGTSYSFRIIFRIFRAQWLQNAMLQIHSLFDVRINKRGTQTSEMYTVLRVRDLTVQIHCHCGFLHYTEHRLTTEQTNDTANKLCQNQVCNLMWYASVAHQHVCVCMCVRWIAICCLFGDEYDRRERVWSMLTKGGVPMGAWNIR